MSKPSILLIPGSFSLPEFYDPVLNAVASKGYEIRGLHLPSVACTRGPQEDAPKTMYDDAVMIAKETEKLANEGKDVILIAHSYGGVPTTESTKGLGKPERKAQGKKGGIVRLAFMTAVVPAVGATTMDVLADVPKELRISFEIDEKGWMSQNPAESAPIVFSDISKEEGVAWVDKFPNHSAISFAGELTNAGYKDIPVSYLLCEDDLCISAKHQRVGIEMVEQVSGKKVDVTSLQSGHFPPISAPGEVVNWIVDVARKVESGLDI